MPRELSGGSYGRGRADVDPELPSAEGSKSPSFCGFAIECIESNTDASDADGESAGNER